ncbi:HAD hydrolase-like protein [Corynebacterium freneyi]|uniref:HAD hydrolase-like protein n=1 Tax=Corynebacterium freneyi TaxID=134034 RepID=UPI001EF2FD33|nr:HAD hydrolase-like protein [Corynebacterium freneyi]MCG7439383.1 HAD hydrolase-like protein [Corynebacterium freneyi]
MAPTLLIDVDGTISDSLAGIQASFRTAMEAVDHPIPEDSFMSTLAGPPMRDSMAKIGLSGDRLDAAMRAYRAAQTDGGWADTRMFPGWVELLDGWRADGIRLATATSKGGHFARKVLAEFGILDRFDFIGAADDGGDRHHKDDVIEHTLRVLGLPAVRRDIDGDGGDALPGVVMIGDRIHDVEGARRFGVPAILVGWGYGPDDERDRADAVAHTPDQLDRMAREMLGL